jgi:fucose permease
MKATRVVFALALLAFVSLGLPDAVLGVAWPYVRRTFSVPLDGLGVLLFAALAGYVASSFFSGRATRRLGVGGVLVVSTLLVAAGAATTALAPRWGVAVAAAGLAGLGGGAIDAAVNAHAAGHFRPGQVAWLHASWGVGAALGPLLMTAVLAGGLSWRWGYGILAAAVAVLALAFARTRGLWEAARPTRSGPGRQMPMAASLREGSVHVNVLLFFLHTGVEGTAGQWAYTVFTESRGMPATAAGLAVGAYWGGLTAGRIVSGAVAHRVAPARVLRFALWTAPAWGLLAASASGPAVDRAALGLLGFTLGPVFPLLIAATPSRVGEGHVHNAVGFQVAAASLGATAVPSLAGVIARARGLETVFVLVVACGALVLAAYETSHRSSPEARGAA